MKFTFQPESRPLDGYTLKRGVARGGFGEVYYALSDAGKEVAVKLLQHNLDVELRGVQQCLNLRHPNLVTIFDVKTDADNDHWVVMEYIGGQTLEQVLQTQAGPLPLDQIERWLLGLAGGLGYLHDRGIVHRDVKPGNVFWDQGTVKLGDIGLSKFMSPSRRSAQTESVGTVYYMAPEVTYGKYGYEVDIYSSGVMLYEMLTGKLPFDGQSTGEILMKHLSEPPDFNLVPAAYRPALISVLEKDPKKRTASMGKLIEDFQRARRGQTAAVADSRPSEFARWMPPFTATEARLADSVPPRIPAADPRTVASPAWTPPRASPIPNTARPVNQRSTEQRVRSENRARAATMSTIDDAPQLAWWGTRLLMFIIVFAVAGSFFKNFPFVRGPVPCAMLLSWPLLFLCLRMQPTRGSGLSWLWHGDHSWLTGGLVQHLEQDWRAGNLVRAFREWDQTIAGYWVSRTFLFLSIQIPLGVLALLIGGDSPASAFRVLVTSALMYLVYVYSLATSRRQELVLVGAEAFVAEPQIRSVPDRLRPAGGAGIPAGVRPGATAGPLPVARKSPGEQRPSTPPPIALGTRANLILADLFQSMNRATVLTLLFGLGVGFLSPVFGTPGSLHPDFGKLGLFTLTTLFGVWAVLMTSRLTANSTGIGRHRRLVGLVTGVALGSFAWWLKQILLVDLSVNARAGQSVFEVVGRQPLALGGQPTWLAYSLFFGLLLGIRRWWWHVDPARPALFRISSVVLTVSLACVLPVVFVFPFDWAVTWAAVMSCVAQLSAGWTPPEARARRA